MDAAAFEYLAQFVRRRSGILLAPGKPYLIEGRLAPVARRFGFRDAASLLRELRHAREPLARAVSEALTTNDSSFFRDPQMFADFRERVLPALIAARAEEKHLRIWSAACAAGQEAYSIAMMLDEMKLADAGWSIDLIATDLSSDQIARAEEGIFSAFEIERGIAPERLHYFQKHGSSFHVQDRLRRMISFRAFNLLDSYGWLHQLDVVFCRNVLIFFDDQTKLDVITKIANVLAPGGAMVVGQAELIEKITDAFIPLTGAAGTYGLRPIRSDNGKRLLALVGA